MLTCVTPKAYPQIHNSFKIQYNSKSKRAATNSFNSTPHDQITGAKTFKQTISICVPFNFYLHFHIERQSASQTNQRNNRMSKQCPLLTGLLFIHRSTHITIILIYIKQVITAIVCYNSFASLHTIFSWQLVSSARPSAFIEIRYHFIFIRMPLFYFMSWCYSCRI